MLISKHGVHGPNSKMADAQNSWGRMRDTNASWAKLLFDSRYPTHTVSDARIARAHGIKVLVRTTGKSADDTRNLMPDEGEVRNAIAHFGALAEVIEVGNEPPIFSGPLGRWDHALRMEEIAHNQTASAHFFGQTLITAGWAMGALDQNKHIINQVPPDTSSSIDQRLREVYNLYDGIGVHLYDPGWLHSGWTENLLTRWERCFPDKPIYVTEYGIAYRWLLRDQGVPDDVQHEPEHMLEKASRYAQFVTSLQRNHPQVVAAFTFLLGGTEDFHNFGTNGENNYWLDDAAWKSLGTRLRG